MASLLSLLASKFPAVQGHNLVKESKCKLLLAHASTPVSHWSEPASSLFARSPRHHPISTYRTRRMWLHRLSSPRHRWPRPPRPTHRLFRKPLPMHTALLTTFAANPAPILSQVAHNQAVSIQNLTAALQTTGGAIGNALTTTVPPLLQAAFNDLATGNVEGAINNVLSATLATVFPITGFIPAASAAFTQPLTNLVNAINAVQEGGVLSPLSGRHWASRPGDQRRRRVRRCGRQRRQRHRCGRSAGQLNAVVHGPATILDGVLNGGYGPNFASACGPAP